MVAEADVHRRVAHQLGERVEDVAVEQHLGGDEVGVVAGRDGELGLLGREQPADRPLVVVARAVVGEHGEAHRAVERRRRGDERAARLRRPVHARGPRVAGVGLQAAQDATGDIDRRAVRADRGQRHRLAIARAPAQCGLGAGHAQQVRPARERRVRRAEQVREPVPDVAPTTIAQTATNRPRAPSAKRARVSRRWRSSSRAIAGSPYRQGRQPEPVAHARLGGLPADALSSEHGPCATRS